MTPFPIYLNNLHEQRCVVIGGNHGVEQKVGELLEVDANVTVIAPDPPDSVKDWADEGRLDWVEREYQYGDLQNTFLAIVCETNSERTHPIWEEAQERNILFNAREDVPHCNFVNASFIRRGPLIISISTSGASPALSVRLRKEMEERFGPEYETFLHMMQDLRDPMTEHYDDFARRRDLWYEIVDSDVLDLLRQGRRVEAVDRIASIVGSEVASAVEPYASKQSNRSSRVAHRLNRAWKQLGAYIGLS